MNLIFAIDPGPRESAFIEFAPDAPTLFSRIVEFGYQENEAIEERIRDWAGRDMMGIHAVIEEMQATGMPVGTPVFKTCEQIGRFDLLWEQASGVSMTRVSHSQVKVQLCGTARAKYKNLRAVLYDRFGGDRRAALGTRKTPGPLYGFKGDDLISALAIAVTWHEQNQGALRQARATGRDPDHNPGHHRSPMAGK